MKVIYVVKYRWTSSVLWTLAGYAVFRHRRSLTLKWKTAALQTNARTRRSAKRIENIVGWWVQWRNGSSRMAHAPQNNADGVAHIQCFFQQHNRNYRVKSKATHFLHGLQLVIQVARGSRKSAVLASSCSWALWWNGWELLAPERKLWFKGPGQVAGVTVRAPERCWFPYH